ncbi:MAG: Fic family protein [Rhodospirillaceae bacterium]|nr:Fic family protein [Rhodospirillaceae bacterium]
MPKDRLYSFEAVSGSPAGSFRPDAEPRLSAAGAEIRDYVRQPPEARTPVGYDRSFLDSYRPNRSFYLSEEERAQLAETGRSGVVEQAAGTYAKRILSRLLIDLSWNSSRLEGNTYSLLDTVRLIEAGQEADGRDAREALMILNHKAAIEFLVDAADDIGFDRYTIFNLHAALADDLLPDQDAPGRLRYAAVGIGGSVFHPLELPQSIEECFDRVLVTAAAIEDPFEQAFFAMVHFPYLQPFDDVNKRVSRLAANIPLIKANLSPLSFDDVSRDLYIQAILGVYELQRTELLRDLFLWAYGRSAIRYAAVRQSIGEPDPFRMRHRTALRDLVGAVIRASMDKKQAAAEVEAWAVRHIEDAERGRFRKIAERELLSLHDGNFARYRITRSEFAAWQKAWRN